MTDVYMERDSSAYKDDKDLFPGSGQLFTILATHSVQWWFNFFGRQTALVQFTMASAFIGGDLSRLLVKYLEGRARSVKEALEGPFT